MLVSVAAANSLQAGLLTNKPIIPTSADDEDDGLAAM